MTWSLSPTISKNKLQKTDRRLMLPVGFLALSPALLSLLLLLLENEGAEPKRETRGCAFRCKRNEK